MAKTVLITGTSTGIGRACVERMAADGWTIYAGVRKKKDGDDVAASIAGDVRPVMLDVTNPKHLAAVVKRLGTELDGRGLDGLVNNAGVAFGGPFEALSDEAWQQHFDINVFGQVRVTRELLPLVIEAKGRVVNVASIAGRVSSPMLTPYSAGKHALEAISQALRFEMEDFGVKVACVEPGEVQSAIWGKGDELLDSISADYSPDVISRYQRHIDMLTGFMSDGPKHGVPASRAAKAVHHALTARWPKHRYLVGPDAKLVGVVGHVPDKLKAPMLSMYAKRWELSGRKMRKAAGR